MLTAPAPAPQDQKAKQGNVLTPMQRRLATGAMGGRKDHRVAGLGEAEKDHVEKAADKGAKDKGQEGGKRDYFHGDTINNRCAPGKLDLRLWPGWLPKSSFPSD